VTIGYTLSPRARKDLFDVVDYIAADSLSAATRIRNEVLAAFVMLAERPGIGHSREDLTDQPLLFWSVRGRYTIVYRPNTAPLEVVRLLGPGRDIPADLR
jgi:plasmid stabilization system protein ParE